MSLLVTDELTDNVEARKAALYRRLAVLDRQIERVMDRNGGAAADLREERLHVRHTLEKLGAA